MRELAVLSGKGGTGKTSIVGSFAALSGNAVLADCDVDAADLHLIMEPVVVERGDYSGSERAVIDPAACVSCGKCSEVCRFGAIAVNPAGSVEDVCVVDPLSCEGCGVCAWFCPRKAIAMREAVNGEWFVSDCRCGPMAHARLGIAEETSGRLVTLVREKAKALASEKGLPLVLIDGSPGTGCPVISSMTGADLVLAVTEPTLSGLHDLRRIADLAGHFGTEMAVCVNRWDINTGLTRETEELCEALNIDLAGRIRFDRAVTEAQLRKRTVVEYAEAGAAEDIRSLWDAVSDLLYVERQA
jgi:MinD superfamily P-loop ATPase